MTRTENEEVRHLHRHQLADNAVSAVNRLSGDLLGSVVNIHEEGFMLLCDKTVEEDHLYQVLLVANLDGEEWSAPVGVDCLWVNKGSADADTNGPSWAGFQIIDISPTATQQLSDIIHRFSVE